jgi:hypothetical protein
MSKHLLPLGAMLCLSAVAAANAEGVEPRRAVSIPRVSGDLEPREQKAQKEPTPASPAGGPREQAQAITDFRQREPGDGTPCSRKTLAWLSRDDDHLYVRFECEAGPGEVRARLSRRDDIAADDRVVVCLDTYGDHRRAYMFACNALGVQLDGMFVEGQDEDDSFDTVWNSAGQLTPTGYTVSLAIPFKSLRFPSVSNPPWRVALGRIIPTRNEEAYWPTITKRLNGFVPQFATVTGLGGISPGRNVQLIPYGISTRARFLDTGDGAPEFLERSEFRGGLDSKVVLHDTYTVDAALQPDFSQVEADEPQVTINQRFEVYFPERRPFFVENANYFVTPAELFFSRRIADPGFGARVTGRSGDWVVGAVAADDRAPGRARPVGDPWRGARAMNEVVSVRREFARESSLGLLATRRSFGAGANHVAALDARAKPTPNWVFAAQAMQSFTRALDGSRHAGPGFVVELTRDGRHVEDLTRYTALAPGFESQLGFVKRIGVRQLAEEFKYRWRPQRGPVEKYGPTLSGLYVTDPRGALQEWNGALGFKIEVSGPSELEVEHQLDVERYAGTDFRKALSSVEFSSDHLHWLGLDARYAWGRDVNFDPAPGLDPFLAGSRQASLALTLRPSPRVSLAQTWIYNGLVGLADLGKQGSVFDNVLLRTKLNLQFTRELSVRAIVDHTRVSPDATRALLDPERRLGVDLLATYLVSPGTAFYVGYSDLLENLALDPSVPASLRRTDVASLSTGRQFFVKASVLVRQ